MNHPKTTYSKSVANWLLLGVGLIFVQIIIGGITRLTGSGLSITRWDIVPGFLPPLNAAAWQEAFDLYKTTAQYQTLNTHFQIGDFKFIFFWEWFHRLWARSIAVIFFIGPFFYFLIKRQLSKKLVGQLMILVALSAVAAIFGWIMVLSGLEGSDRVAVNPFKLALHFGLALVIIVYAFRIWIRYRYPNPISLVGPASYINWLFGLVGLQLVLGALVSGYRAVLMFPSWPKMNGEWIPSALAFNNWSWDNLIAPQGSLFASAITQFVHRGVAYCITIFMVYLLIKAYKNYKEAQLFQRSHYVTGGIVLIQVLLGIFTLLAAKHGMPIALASIHQGVAIILLLSIVWLKRRFA